jgi:hypoxanthine phosphoribosyltransferase
VNANEVDVLYHPEEIARTVERLGKEISAAYAGEELLIVGILKGAFMFVADLARCLTLPVKIDFMRVSSYGGAASSSGEVRILKDLESGIEGRHVLVVEDIVDSGLTFGYLLKNLRSRNPASLKTCCLLDKPSRRVNDIQPDFVGYAVEDLFLVGYGLDYDDRYRSYPAICILKEHIYQT